MRDKKAVKENTKKYTRGLSEKMINVKHVI